MNQNKSWKPLIAFRKSALFFVRSVIDQITRASYPLAARIEIEIKRSLGKGFGSKSIEAEVRAVLKLLKIKEVSELTVVDVGANFGEYTAAILKHLPNSNIYAFEPSVIARKSLEERFSNDPRVKISHFALSSSPGVGELWTDYPGSGLASLTKRNLEHLGQDFVTKEEVEIETLDNLFKNIKHKPALIKIDVEGNELNVIKGASDAIMSCQLVQFEFGGCNVDTRTYFKDYWMYFSERNFTLYRVTPVGVKKIKAYSEHDECFITTNYIAVKNKEVLDS